MRVHGSIAGRDRTGACRLALCLWGSAVWFILCVYFMFGKTLSRTLSALEV